jgi:para-nitrobenzyl esterase
MAWRKILFGLALLCGAAQAAPVVTGQGPVEGLAKSGVMQFLGLAYAAPPVGRLRWMPPQPAAKWTGVKQAARFGPTCSQVTTLGPFAGPPNANEDCLYLNVFTPDVKARLPVLVWIHGGGYVDGESNDYDASKLARDGKLVVVTINYRLNLFGFLAVPALNGSGNYGLEDMQAALRWVHDNIAAFGGDAGNVTVGGQSAGAGAAAAMVVSPGAKGLIHRAIFQSGGYTPFAKKEMALERGRKFVAAAGCGTAKDVAACMRALPAEKVVALAGTPSANGPFINGPLVDGTVIPRQTIDAIQRGQFNKVPVMIGTTHDEGNFFNGIIQYFKPDHAPINETDYHAYLKSTYGGNAGPGGSPPAYAAATLDSILKQYSPQTMGAQGAWDRAHSDMLACRGQYVAGALSKQVPVYSYLFDDPAAPTYFPKMPGYQSLAYHTSDIQYVFAGYHGGPDGLPTHLTPKQQRLSDRLIAAWSNFAHTGNPNGSGDAPWPNWKTDGPSYFIQTDAWNAVQTNPQFAAAHQCGFWQSILLYR